MHGEGGDLPVNIWGAAAILIFCVLMSALFSGSETAMTAASKARMHALEKQGDPRAAIVIRMLGGPTACSARCCWATPCSISALPPS